MRIKEHPIANCRLKNITAINLQEYIDFLVFGKKGGIDTGEISRGYLRIFTAVLQRAFKFAVFPKGYINYNPMEYVSIRRRKNNAGLFAENDEYRQSSSTITHQQYQQITEYLERRNNPALLPIQIAYYTGLRIGEVCGLAWQDINIEEQYMTIRRSMRYNITLHRTEIDTTKRNKVRTVHFGNTLTDILKAAMDKQHLCEISCGTSYYYNYYAQTSNDKRIHYEIYSINSGESVPAEYKKISFTCCRNNGLYEAPSTIASICRMLGKKIDTLNGFHFHMLRHTYTSNLLRKGASPKDVQELLGHTSVNTTLNIYAHSSQDAKHNSAILLDNI